jgi:predicted CoA-binding protein
VARWQGCAHTSAPPPIAREPTAIAASTLSCQFGVTSEEAARIAEDSGVKPPAVGLG